MKRIGLFLLTNIAVLAVIAVSFRILGLDTALAADGRVNLGALLAMSAVIGFAGSLVSLAMSKWSAARMVGARTIAQPANATEHWLIDTVRRQADQAGIGMPDVAIFDSPEPNAFATGARRDHALVAVSTGLLATMSKDEVEAVLAHEVSHVANGDMVTLALIQGVVNTFVVFLSRLVGYFVDRVLFKSEDGHGPGFFISSMIAQLLFGVLASVVVMWFSRQREFRADAGAAALAGRERMIAALERLRERHQAAGLPDQLAASGIAGGARSGLMALFMSHPPLEARIEALRKAARA